MKYAIFNFWIGVLHENNQIETERFNEFYKNSNEQLSQLERTIPTLEGEIKILKEHTKSSKFILEEAKSLYDNWGTLFTEEKRNVVKTIGLNLQSYKVKSLKSKNSIIYTNICKMYVFLLKFMSNFVKNNI